LTNLKTPDAKSTARVEESGLNQSASQEVSLDFDNADEHLALALNPKN